MAWFYDTWQEHCDYEANARYDYLREAFGATAEDANEFAASEEAYWLEREREESMDDMMARGGPAPNWHVLLDDEIPF